MPYESILRFLTEYDGEKTTIMEICGSHTAAIEHNGIRSLLSPAIRLVSGPGCPVCVTVSAYIDRLIELSKRPENVIVTFGDLIRVPGSGASLSDAAALGADVRMVYSPMDILTLAKKEPDRVFIFAAVGFETTAPVYARLVELSEEDGQKNVRLLTSLKTMPEVVDILCSSGGEIDGFLAPGHVCAVSGYRIFEPLAEKYNRPFVAAGFEGNEIMAALYALVRLKGRGVVRNLYPRVVTAEGNTSAIGAVSRIFEKGDASWRGLGRIASSGLYLRKEYERFDAGSRGLDRDRVAEGCRCAFVLQGKETSTACPLFGKNCTPSSPKGACMVSGEGSCFNAFQNSQNGLDGGFRP
ncbi:MAG: hydrogenase formation protein HypD [Lachnospiraceae bacterium]|nr:hydrogenase formation protein HypD [Lachnospiraceae bacterium]